MPVEADRPATLAERRRDIEGLRGLAILMVVAYHARLPFAAGGFTGVDVFFAISGYLIAGQLARELARSGTIDLVAFYARRARRLLPAAALVILLTALASRLVLAPLEQVAVVPAALASALYVANFWFAAQATDYLSAPPESSPLLHMWSLSVEEQFYLAWPLLTWTGWRLRGLFGAGLVTLAVAILSLGLMLQFNNTAHAWTFFGPHARAWEFAAGAVAALLPWRPRGAAASFGGLTGLVAIVVAAVAYGADTPFPGLATVVPVGGAVAILLSQDRSTTAVLGMLEPVGRVSYSWYLWHWPVIVLAGTLLPGIGAAGRTGAAALALVLAVAAQALVEELYGDSHAAQWFPALEALSLTRGWQLASVTKMGCPAAGIPVSLACDRWREAALAHIRRLKPALVVVASASVYLAEVGRSAGVSDKAWSEGTQRALDTLRDFRTVLLVDVPQPGFDPAMCLARRGWHPWLRTDCRFSRSAVPAVSRAAGIERVAAADLSHVRVVDLSDAVCDSSQCEPMRDNLVLYRDGSHITASFSRSLEPALAAGLDALSWR